MGKGEGKGDATAVECGGKVPGPQYKLATVTGYRGHCLSKYRNPAYSVAHRTLIIDGRCSPGPKYHFRKYLTRVGPNDPPAYTIPGRHPPLDPGRLPGPGAYCPEKAPPMWHTRPPKYSLQSRNPPPRPGRQPGPLDYPPPRPHRYPAYSIVGKPKLQKGGPSPGAAAYGGVPVNKYLRRQPEVSLTGRNYPPLSQGRIPGPDAYFSTFNTKTNAPKYSLRRQFHPCIGVFVLPHDN